jgi:hypothetical protein
MVHGDEMRTLLADLDQSEKATLRGFNLSLLGTTQPRRLASYIRDGIRRFDDGLVQRLQLLTRPDLKRTRT